MPETDIKTALERLQRIENNKDRIIEKIEAFFDQRGQNPKVVVPVERSQLQNVLRLALSTTSVQEVKLFIRYQCGRAKRNEGWKNRNFGETLNTTLTEVIEETQDNPGLSIELVRLFLGYLIREARYRRPDNSSGDE